MHTTLKIYSVAVLLAAWVGFSLVFSEQIIPGPIPVFEAIWENLQSGEGLFHLYKTVSRVVLGLIMAMFLGSGLGLIMGLSIKGEKFFESWVMVGLTIPAVVYAIICLLWFGLNDFAAVVAIGITAAPLPPLFFFFFCFSPPPPSLPPPPPPPPPVVFFLEKIPHHGGAHRY